MYVMYVCTIHTVHYRYDVVSISKRYDRTVATSNLVLYIRYCTETSFHAKEIYYALVPMLSGARTLFNIQTLPPTSKCQ